MILPLTKTTDPAAPRIVLLRIENADPSRLRIEDGVKLILMILDILLHEDDNFVIAGQHLFIDDMGISVNHLLQLTPAIIKKIQTCLIDAYALRLKGFHVINVPQFAEAAYNMFKSIMNEKVLNRVSSSILNIFIRGFPEISNFRYEFIKRVIWMKFTKLYLYRYFPKNMVEMVNQ